MAATKELNGPQQLEAVVKLALEAGHRRAADLISQLREDRYPHGDWPLGRCLPCEIENKLVKATFLDIGSGTPECDRHADERFEQPKDHTPPYQGVAGEEETKS